MQITEALNESLKSYSKQNEQQLIRVIQNLVIKQQIKQQFNSWLLEELTNSFMHVISEKGIEDLCSLLRFTFSSIKNKSINKSILITILDSILECIGVTDLKQLLHVIRDQIGNLGTLDQMGSFHILRVINSLLKRISKTTDFCERGQLHLTITKILSICHESGFVYRPFPVEMTEKLKIDDPFFSSFQDSTVSGEFFQNFWQIQKYYMDLQQLSNCKTQAGDKQDTKLIPIRLKKIQIILDDILKYLKINPPIEDKDFSTFPLKFLKLPNLLSLQLQDSYFRAIIIIQTLLFCASLKTFPVKYPIEMNADSKETVKRIQKKAFEYLHELQERRKDGKDLVEMVDKFVKNQGYWIGLKDNWKEKKKVFFLHLPKVQTTELSKKGSLNENVNSENAAPKVIVAEPVVATKRSKSIAQVIKQSKKQIHQQMDIKPKCISSFLQQSGAPVLKSSAISPSFSYYFSQSKSCLETFDQQQQCQTYFQSRSEYNIFEWKAFRSLQRERIVKNKDVDQSSKLADHKLLDFIRRNQILLQGEPKKKVKPNEQEGQ